MAQLAGALMADGKGVLAIDESPVTCNRRFAEIGIEQTIDSRRAYRQMIVTTPGLGRSISGAILHDETMGQYLEDGRSIVSGLTDAGIIPGIKVDTGVRQLAGHDGERVTEGLDGLRDRLASYADRGARFAKWRAVLAIGQARPSGACIAVNAKALGRYAVLCQEAGLVPIIEPEVLMDGGHDIECCGDVTGLVLRHVFIELIDQGAMLEGVILKPNMIVPGLACAEIAALDAVAERTVTCLLRSVPAAVPGIAFLSGGQSPQLASQRLDAIVKRAGSRAPWAIGFSFARGIQQPALAAWHGRSDRVVAAQQALERRARCNRAARQGRYDAAMEASGPPPAEVELRSISHHDRI